MQKHYIKNSRDLEEKNAFLNCEKSIVRDDYRSSLQEQAQNSVYIQYSVKSCRKKIIHNVMRKKLFKNQKCASFRING